MRLQKIKENIGKIYPASIIGVLHINGYTVPIHKHAMERTISRQVLPSDIDKILKKLNVIKSSITRVQPRQKFWIYDPKLDVSLGMMKLEDNEIQLNTVLDWRPHEQGLVDIIEIPAAVDEEAIPPRPAKPPLPKAPNAAELARMNRELQGMKDPVDPTGSLQNIKDIIAQIRTKETEINALNQELQKLTTNYKTTPTDAFAPPQSTTNVKTDPRNRQNWVGTTTTGNPIGGGPITRK